MVEIVLSFLSGIIQFPVTGHASRSVTEEGDYLSALNLNCPNQTLSYRISNFIGSKPAFCFLSNQLLTGIAGINYQMNPSSPSLPN